MVEAAQEKMHGGRSGGRAGWCPKNKGGGEEEEKEEGEEKRKEKRD